MFGHLQLLQTVLLQSELSVLFSRAMSRFDGCIATSVPVKCNVNRICRHRDFCKNPFSVAYNGQMKSYCWNVISQYVTQTLLMSVWPLYENVQVIGKDK